MTYEIDMGEETPFNLLAKNEEEILQNVRMILSTPKGSVTLNRKFGIDLSLLDMPLGVVENTFTAAIVEAIQESEPRAIVEKVIYYKDHEQGKIIPKVRIRIDA